MRIIASAGNLFIYLICIFGMLPGINETVRNYPNYSIGYSCFAMNFFKTVSVCIFKHHFLVQYLLLTETGKENVKVKWT